MYATTTSLHSCFEHDFAIPLKALAYTDAVAPPAFESALLGTGYMIEYITQVANVSGLKNENFALKVSFDVVDLVLGGTFLFILTGTFRG